MLQSDEDVRFCQSCGERHEAEAVYCPSCGQEVNKSVSSKQDSSSSEPDGQKKSSRKRKALVSLGIVFGAAVLIAGGLFFIGGGENGEATVAGGGQASEVPAAETVVECVVDRGYITLANRTSSLIEEMGSSLNLATAIGTRGALLRALEGLNTVYGPAFSSLAGDWRAIDDCGDQKLASYTNDIASELSAMGFTFTSLGADDTAALARVAGNMGNISVIASDLAAYIGSL